MWLDPENAKVWADVIAATLSKTDPANAAAYAANAEATKARLDDLISRLDTRVAAVKGKPFIVFRDVSAIIYEVGELDGLGT